MSLFKKKKTAKLYAPCTGKVTAISDVNDPVFSQKMLGDGFAVIPDDYVIYAPLAGKITTIFPTKHAINIKSKTGIDYLIHIGLDTVELKGEPFKILVEENQHVTTTEPLVKVDFDKIVACEKDPTVIVAFIEQAQISEITVQDKTVDHGEVCGEIKRT